MITSKKTDLPVLSKSSDYPINNWWKAFLFFIGWPFIYLFNTITFYLAIAIIYKLGDRVRRNLFRIDRISFRFYLFAFVVLLSLILAPPIAKAPGFFADALAFIQFIYWMIMAILMYRFSSVLRWREASKYLAIGLGLSTLNFLFFNINLPIPIIKLHITRNSFVYNLIALWPLASYYLFYRYGKKGLHLGMLFTTAIMVVSNGRAGFSLILLENLLLLMVYYPTFSKAIRIGMLIALPFAGIISGYLSDESRRASLASVFEQVAPRIADFIEGKGASGDLSFDKSWLIRELMIDKSMEILTEYPLTGVGVFHFPKYESEMSTRFSAKYLRLFGGRYNADYFNKFSTHNSYIMVLAEMGYLGFISLLIIIVPIILSGLKLVITGGLTQRHLPMVSILVMAIHWYVITSLPGTVTWVLIGMAYASSKNRFQL